MDLRYLEGRRFCAVLAKLSDENDPDSPVKMRCLHGRANIDREGWLSLESADGASFGIPRTAYPNILPADNTEMLRDAEYFVLVKVSGMEL